jgi:hypothetical protein
MPPILPRWSAWPSTWPGPPSLEEQGGKVLFHTAFNPYFRESLKPVRCHRLHRRAHTAHPAERHPLHPPIRPLLLAHTIPLEPPAPHPAPPPEDRGNRRAGSRPARPAGLILPRLLHLGTADLKGPWRGSLRLPSLRRPDESPRRHHRSPASCVISSRSATRHRGSTSAHSSSLSSPPPRPQSRSSLVPAQLHCGRQQAASRPFATRPAASSHLRASETRPICRPLSLPPPPTHTAPGTTSPSHRMKFAINSSKDTSGDARSGRCRK